MSSFNNIVSSMKEINFQSLLLKENVASLLLFVLILLTVICILVYYFYMRNLLSKECSAMDNLYSALNTKIHSLNTNDPNCKYNLRDYYIKTAYNCCSAGAYKNDFVGTCALKDVLRQGVRGLDFEIYSVANQPVVSTSTSSSYYVKETYNYVAFSDVMTIINNYAFSQSTAPNPQDPIIFHLRFMSNNQKMYSELAALFKNYDSLFLGPEFSFENEQDSTKQNLGSIPLLSLQRKIIIIADNSNKSFSANPEFYEYVNLTSNSVFMRALRYYDVKNTPDITELQTYNKQNMTISLPDISATPLNPSAIICRETGCQMIAMCYQLNDVYLQENNQFFDQAGYAFVLKPENLRYKEITIPAPTEPNPALSYQTRNVSSQYYSFNI
uniref:PI-PLC Y-box domain-containing protein n=1 Tax=viral metagenome TaxID=1070528 RepID=A0A6C0LG90_9ZZZZ